MLKAFIVAVLLVSPWRSPATATPLYTGTAAATVDQVCIPRADLEALITSTRGTVDRLRLQANEQNGILQAFEYLRALPTPATR